MAETIRKKFWQDVVKVAVFMVFYSLLHFLHDMIPNMFTQAIAGTDESFLQHIKIGVFAYLFTNLFELVIYGKALYKRTGFWFSRILSNLLLPWLMFLVWYPLPTLMGRGFSTTWMEVLYSIAVVIVVCILLTVLERNTEKTTYTAPSKILLVILFIIQLALLVAFSFRLPYFIGFFAV
jgi:hypothetical protein